MRISDWSSDVCSSDLYGTLLCISEKPLHGEINLAGMAGEFYRQRVGQHLDIGLKALEKLKTLERERLHSRKLRSFAEVAFQSPWRTPVDRKSTRLNSSHSCAPLMPSSAFTKKNPHS